MSRNWWIVEMKLIPVNEDILKKLEGLFWEKGVQMKHYQADTGSDGYFYLCFENENYEKLLRKHGLEALIPHVNEDRELWLTYST